MSTKDISNKFNTAITSKLKIIDRNYVGNKLDPKDWADYINYDEDFKEEFMRIYTDDSIPEADDYTPDILDDTYLNATVTPTPDTACCAPHR